MKKCGIITFHRTSNFGSCLQAYGLYRKIVDLEYSCEIIDYRCPAVEAREGLGKKYPFTPKGIAKRFFQQSVINRKYRNLMAFLNKNTVLSESLTPDTIDTYKNFYDKCIVGSDIVWDLDITQGDYNFFLNFVDDPARKYAFASSVGNHNATPNDHQMGLALSTFGKIAVREKGTVDWVRRLSGKEAKWVCDPTLLLTAQEWESVIPPKAVKGDYVLVYFQDNDGKCMRDAQAYAKQNGLKVYHISNSLIPAKGVRNCKPTTLEEFLGLIRNAKFIFTASYHGMLFSLYFHKEFVFYTRAHSERVLSLAERLGVQSNCADHLDIGYYEPIDYDQVEKKLQQFRNESIAILTEMLEE